MPQPCAETLRVTPAKGPPHRDTPSHSVMFAPTSFSTGRLWFCGPPTTKDPHANVAEQRPFKLSGARPICTNKSAYS